MCEITDDLKLCTCKDKESQSIGTWSLKRYKDVDWMTVETGRCLVLRFDDNDKSNIEFILDTLMFKTPFDFEYKAEDGDILNIYLNNGKHYEFEYKDQFWNNCEQLSDHLNKQLIIQKGNINN